MCASLERNALVSIITVLRGYRCASVCLLPVGIPSGVALDVGTLGRSQFTLRGVAPELVQVLGLGLVKRDLSGVYE